MVCSPTTDVTVHNGLTGYTGHLRMIAPPWLARERLDQVVLAFEMFMEWSPIIFPANSGKIIVQILPNGLEDFTEAVSELIGGAP